MKRGDQVHPGVRAQCASDDGAPEPWRRFTRPGGTPGFLQRLHEVHQADSGVSEEGFKTTALPQRSAGKIFQDGIAMGKFQGVIMAHTPTGARTDMARTCPAIPKWWCGRRGGGLRRRSRRHGIHGFLHVAPELPSKLSPSPWSWPGRNLLSSPPGSPWLSGGLRPVWRRGLSARTRRPAGRRPRRRRRPCRWTPGRRPGAPRSRGSCFQRSRRHARRSRPRQDAVDKVVGARLRERLRHGRPPKFP